MVSIAPLRDPRTAATCDWHEAELPPKPRHGFRQVNKHARLMIIDDEELNVDLVQSYLEDHGYNNFSRVMDPRLAIPMIMSEHPDAVLLDIRMPGITGLDILETMRQDASLARTPVIILTASTDAETKLKALRLGASDFLAKPVDPSELVLRLGNVLAAKAHEDSLEDYSQRLEQQVLLRTAELAASRQEVINCLALAAEYRDDDTGQHVRRVGLYAGVLAEELGFGESAVDLLTQAAQLHDVGKIGVSDLILLKPGKLTPDEFEQMQRHCEFGQNILYAGRDTEVDALRKHTAVGTRILDACSSPILRLAATIAATHHERWDGSGYPHGLAGEDIPVEGRITAVADVFDALGSERPYKPAFPLPRCLKIMEEGRGTHFDPRVLDAFFNRLDQILEIREQCRDAAESGAS